MGAIWQIVAAVAGVTIPVSSVLWYLIRTEMRNQILQLHLTLTERVASVEGRVTGLERAALLRLDAQSCS
jgi:hypothetical protein